MASQGERVLGGLVLCSYLESMVQDGDPEQEMLVVQEQEPPQLNPEPEVDAAVAAAFDPRLASSTKPLPRSWPNRFT